MSHPWLSSLKREPVVLAAFLIISFAAYTWANQFPYFYHSDEESKALQVLHGYRNYWHPMLMLNATALICDVIGLRQDAQSVTVVGRFIAAACSSIGIAAWVHFGIRRKGLMVGISTGVFLLALPLLFEVSHYCKEDPALLMGFALSLCAVNAFLSNPDEKRTVLLGLAVGVTISAKYVGVILLPFVLVPVFRQSRGPRLGAGFLLSVVAAILAINWQWMFHFSEVLSGLKKEGNMLAFGHDGVAGRLPHFLYWRILRDQQGWPLLIAAGAGWVASSIKRKFSMETLFGIATFVGVTLMSFSPKISERYLLPFMAITIYLAAVGFAQSGKWISPRWRVVFYTIFLPVLMVHQLSLLGKFVSDFQTDSRSALASWIRVHLPENAPIMSSLWTRLPGIYHAGNNTAVGYLDYVADHGTIEELRERGDHWVAVADVESEKFLEEPKSGSETSKMLFLARRKFYQRLPVESDLLWSAPRGTVYVQNPGLKLYRIRP